NKYDYVIKEIDLNNMKKPGYALIVSKNAKTLFERYEGFADIDNSTKITPNTKFRIASLTKPFTVMLTLKLIEEKRIKLSDKLLIYFPLLPSWAKEVTIENLLNHTSGIPDYEKILDNKSYKSGQEPKNIDAISVLTGLNNLVFKPNQ